MTEPRTTPRAERPVRAGRVPWARRVDAQVARMERTLAEWDAQISASLAPRSRADAPTSSIDDLARLVDDVAAQLAELRAQAAESARIADDYERRAMLAVRAGHDSLAVLAIQDQRVHAGEAALLAAETRRLAVVHEAAAEALAELRAARPAGA